MPLKQIDYQKAVIYKIQHLENEELLYVGSTTNFIKRKQQHKCCYNTPSNKSYNFKVYKMIRDNGGWTQFTIIIIKEFPCNTKTELLIEEDRMMRELKSNMNNRRAFTTDEEKKELQKELQKELYEVNKEIILEKQKVYRGANKDKIKERNKLYIENNKITIKERKKEKFVCECGSNSCIDHKARHLNSLKHKQYLLINTK